MSLVFNTKTFNADSYQKDTVAYNGPLKTVSVKDDLSLKRTAPKVTTVFSGVGRTQAKLTRTLNLTGAKTAVGDAIISVDISVPVGYASADVDTLINDFAALMALASFKTHVKTQQVTF